MNSDRYCDCKRIRDDLQQLIARREAQLKKQGHDKIFIRKLLANLHAQLTLLNRDIADHSDLYSPWEE